MKNLLKSKKFFAAMAIVMIIAILVPTAVFATAPSGDANEINQNPGSVGRLTFQGSTTVGPIIQQAAAAYNSYRGGSPVITSTASPIIVQNGSGDGRAAAIDHWTDIGMSSGIPSGGWGTGTASVLTAYAIARDGMVFIVNSSVTNINNLTQTQIANIYNGVYTNWNQITDAVSGQAGPNLDIVPRARIIGSGTRASWKDAIGSANDPTNGKITYLSTDQDPPSGSTAPAAGPMAENWLMYKLGLTTFPRIATNVDMQSTINNSASHGQCGYVGLGFETGENIVDINIVRDNIAYAPNGPNIYSGVYPLARFLFLCIPNDYTPANETTDVQNFITWMRKLDGDGQAAVTAEAFLILIPNQDVTHDGHINVLDLIAVGNKVGQTTDLGRADVDRNGSMSVLDLISVGNYCGIDLAAYPPNVY